MGFALKYIFKIVRRKRTKPEKGRIFKAITLEIFISFTVSSAVTESHVAKKFAGKYFILKNPQLHWENVQLNGIENLRKTDGPVRTMVNPQLAKY